MVALALVLAGAVSAGAEVVTIGPLKDNTNWFSLDRQSSNGAGDYLFAGRSDARTGNGGVIRRAFLAFDVAAAIPALSTINSVTLTIYKSKGAGTLPMAIHRVTQDWGEAGSNAAANEGMGAPAQIGDVTWVHAFHNTVPWMALGGDFVPDASGVATVGGGGAYIWASTEQMVADVQSWLDDAAANFGWVVRGVEVTEHTAGRFNSRTHPTVATRPILVIDYTPPETPAVKTTWGSIKDRYR